MNSIRRRIGAVALAAGLVLGSGTLIACESDTQKEIEDLEKDVKKGLDEVEDEINKGNGGGNN
jgi:hypothetical protein